MIKFMFERTELKNDDELIFKIRKALRLSKDVKISLSESWTSFTTYTLMVDVPYHDRRAKFMHRLLKNASLPITNVWRIKNGSENRI